MSKLNCWLLVGFSGQALFTARFVVQWLASERKRDSVVPVAFWWLSLLGGSALLAYAISRQDPVIFVGQAMGLLVYVRNLMLVTQTKRTRTQGIINIARQAIVTDRSITRRAAAPKLALQLSKHFRPE
jgi:lipid-A-disaccharide synthase-like uncharacterized protein